MTIDTCVLVPESVHFLVRTMGEDRILFGSNCPFDVDAEGRGAIPAIREFESRVQTKILSGNALTLLPARR